MARRKYRSKLEKIMTEKCDLTYETTVEDCQKWFNILNRELFNNSLPKVEHIDVRWRRGAYAKYEYESGERDPNASKLLMNRRYKSKRFFVEVLAHEMVHHYQYLNNEEMGHGPSFMKWRGKFNKKGLNLVRAY